MAHKTFCIDVDGIPRKIFTVQERSSGDLTIIIKHGVNYTLPDSYDFLPSSKIIEQRISVHTSPESNSLINVIKMTLIIADGRKLYTRNFTRSIKVEKLFSAIYTSRSPSLSNKRANFTPKLANSMIALGDYDPTFCQLIFQIFVGAPDREFKTYCKHDLNMVEVKFRNFNIVVLWSFMSFPSDTTGNFLSFQTLTDEERSVLKDPIIIRLLEFLTKGFDEEECIDIFRVSRKFLSKIYFDHSSSVISERDRLYEPLARRVGSSFFKDGNKESRQAIEHLRRCRLMYDLPSPIR